ncbi:MAG TPA: FHA domain-containing protein [Candidatus Acidoferrum sp.]
MGLLLEIKAGPFASKKVTLASGQSLIIGRAPDRAQFAIPPDNHMSGVHFAVECGPSGCRITDKKSTNGTFLNGARIQEAMLATGDEIKCGQTVFAVRIVPDDQLPVAAPSAPAAAPVAAPKQPLAPVAAPKEASPQAGSASRAPVVAPSPQPPPVSGAASKFHEEPVPIPSAQASGVLQPVVAQPTPARQPASVVRPSCPSQPPALAIGSWAFSGIPTGWQVQEGLGIQLDTKDDKLFPTNIGAMEEPFGPGITLSQYVEAQTKMFREYLSEPKIDATLPPKIPGATETIGLEVRFSTKDGPSVYYRRVYARSGSTVGILTLTTLEEDFPSVRDAYESFLTGASFFSQS